MKKILSLLTLTLLSVTLFAQDVRLQFRKDGKFKIVQFTDIHWKPEHLDSQEAIDAMNVVLDAEKPDLVIYTGDNVTGNPVRSGLDQIFRPVVDRKIPFCVVFGNHDHQFGMTYEEVYEYMKQFSLNLTSTVKGITGVTNFSLPVYSSKTTGKVACVVYGLDSYMSTGFGADQVEWFSKTSAQYTKDNAGWPVPSLAYFHVPLPQMQQALDIPRTRVMGTRKEAIAAQRVDNGMFKAFEQSGTIMGIFYGHDHLNDFVLCYERIMQCYGRVTGSRRTSHYNLPSRLTNTNLNGARVVEVTEGDRYFESWIRLSSGERIQGFIYPYDFIDD